MRITKVNLAFIIVRVVASVELVAKRTISIVMVVEPVGLVIRAISSTVINATHVGQSQIKDQNSIAKIVNLAGLVIKKISNTVMSVLRNTVSLVM